MACAWQGVRNCELPISSLTCCVKHANPLPIPSYQYRILSGRQADLFIVADPKSHLWVEIVNIDYVTFLSIPNAI